jgi:uncharacterized protein (DUF849 family)
MTAAIITAALTGPIATKADNPALPTSPLEIADAAVGAWDAGAAIVHVHVRDAAGAPTADLEIARRTVGLIEERCSVLVQLSTGVGLGVPFEEREELVLALHAEGLLAEPLQFSIVLGVRGGAPATAASLLSMVARIPEGAAWQAIGIGRANLELTTIGLALGGNARTGMEDTLLMRRGVPASSNAELVARLVNIARAIEREPADPAQAEALLSLPRAA